MKKMYQNSHTCKCGGYKCSMTTDVTLFIQPHPFSPGRSTRTYTGPLGGINPSHCSPTIFVASIQREYIWWRVQGRVNSRYQGVPYGAPAPTWPGAGATQEGGSFEHVAPGLCFEMEILFLESCVVLEVAGSGRRWRPPDEDSVETESRNIWIVFRSSDSDTVEVCSFGQY